MEIKIILESRGCKVCGNYFKAMVGSSQKFCNILCANESTKTAAHRNQLKKGRNTKEKRSAKDIRATTSFVFNTWQNKNQDAIRTLQKQGKKIEPVTIETETLKLNDGSSGVKITVNNNDKLIGNGMQETKNEIVKQSMPQEKDASRGEVSINANSTIETDVSPSMNLLDNTATHLYDLMKGLSQNQPETSIKLFDVERVHAAANCAKNIREIMKLKLEVIKVKHGI